MKRVTLTVASLLFVAPFALADICSEVATNYDQQYLTKARSCREAIAQATDPEFREAIQASCDIDLENIRLERENVLNSLGCMVQPLPPDPEPPVEEPPVEEPPVEEPPVEEPPVEEPPVEEPPVEEPPVEEPPVEEPPVEEPGNPPTCPPPSQSCLEQLDAYADVLRAQGVRQNEFVHKMLAKIRELGCVKNYGQWCSKWKKRCTLKKQRCVLKKKAVCVKKKQQCFKPQPKPKSRGCKR